MQSWTILVTLLEMVGCNGRKRFKKKVAIRAAALRRRTFLALAWTPRAHFTVSTSDLSVASAAAVNKLTSHWDTRS